MFDDDRSAHGCRLPWSGICADRPDIRRTGVILASPARPKSGLDGGRTPGYPPRSDPNLCSRETFHAAASPARLTLAVLALAAFAPGSASPPRHCVPAEVCSHQPPRRPRPGRRSRPDGPRRFAAARADDGGRAAPLRGAADETSSRSPAAECMGRSPSASSTAGRPAATAPSSTSSPASARAPIATFAFLGPHYDDLLVQNYAGVTAAQVFTRRCVWRWIWSDSLASSEPLERTIEANVTPALLCEVAQCMSRGGDSTSERRTSTRGSG